MPTIIWPNVDKIIRVLINVILNQANDSNRSIGLIMKMPKNYPQLKKLYHQQDTLLKCLDELQAFVGRCDNENDLYDMHIFLEIIAIAHFSEQERLMSSCGFYEYQFHQRMHLLYLKRLQQIRFNRTIINGTVNYLAQWLKDHLLREDKRFYSFLAAKKMPVANTIKRPVQSFMRLK